MSEIALSVNKVSFKAGKKLILDDLNFEIAKGSVFGVVGHNGAGKTTLFHLLLGLKIQTSGEILMHGKTNLEAQARAKLGYVPERPYVNLELTFFNFLRFHANLMGIARGNLKNEIDIAAKTVDLEKSLEQDLSTFSKGMLQKALLAQAVIGNPEILILDEPMSGLDPEARESVRQQIVALKKMGKTLIFSSHAHDDVAQLADHVLGIKAGKVDFVGSVVEWGASRK